MVAGAMQGRFAKCPYGASKLLWESEAVPGTPVSLHTKPRIRNIQMHAFDWHECMHLIESKPCI